MNEMTRQFVDVDYMSIGYDLIEEPLNLKEIGQKWFCELLNEHGGQRGNALILGSVVWMASSLIRNYSRVFVIDKSEAALDRLSSLEKEKNFQAIYRLNCDWQHLSSEARELSLITADNSLHGWPTLLTMKQKLRGREAIQSLGMRGGAGISSTLKAIQPGTTVLTNLTTDSRKGMKC